MKTRKLVLILSIAAIWLGLAFQAAVAQLATLRPDAWLTNGVIHDIAFSNGVTYIGGEFNFVTMPTGTGAALSIRTATTSSMAPPFPLPKANGAISAVIPDGAGGWYIGGEFTAVDDFSRLRLAHILANGTVDPIWKPDVSGGSTPRIFALAKRGNVVYAGGDFTQIGGQARTNIAALDATTGQPIWTSSNSLNNANGIIRALAIAGRTIYVGGAFTTIGGANKNRLAALDTAGNATTWSPSVSGGTNPVVLAIDVSGSTVYIGGSFTTITTQTVTQTRTNIAALDAISGNPTNWQPNADGIVRALVVSGNTVYAGGNFTTIGGGALINLAAIDANGISNDKWNPRVSGGQVFSLAVHGSAVYVGGRFTSIGNETRRHLAALDINSAVPLPWNPNLSMTSSLSTTSDTLFSVFALATSGLTVYAGGTFRTGGGVVRNNLAAFDFATGRPTEWNPNANGVARALAVSGSTVYAGGSFTSIGSALRNRLAALDAMTGTALSWNPNVEVSQTIPNPEINAITVADTIVYAGGSFTNVGGPAQPQHNNIAALSAATGRALGWNTTSTGRVRALAVRAPLLYAGGEFTSMGGRTRNFLAALDAKTGVVSTTWDPNVSIESSATAIINALTVSDSTVYAGGRFTMVGGQSRNAIVALNARSGMPTPWNANIITVGSTAPVVRSITVDGGKVYFGGEFTRVDGEQRGNVALVDADKGLPVTGWNPNVSGGVSFPSFTIFPSVLALEAVGATVFVGGNFATLATALSYVSHSNFAPLGEPALNPVPVAVSLSPTTGERLQTLEVTIEGMNFVNDISTLNAGSGIAVNSVAATSPTTLTANITITSNASTGTRSFSVTNNPPGGGTSISLPFTIINPAPSVESIAPTNGLRGQTLNVAVTGSNFINGATSLNLGSDILVNFLTINSATQLTANITIGANAAFGDREVQVTNTFPGGGAAILPDAFAVNNPQPTLASLTPASGNRLQRLDVVFTGTGFAKGITTVKAEPGIIIHSATVTSSTSLTANITITVQAATGPRPFLVTNAPPGGGASVSLSFTVNNPAPTLARIEPNYGGKSEKIDIILIGTNFIEGASTVSLGADININSIAVKSDTQITANLAIPFDAPLGDRTVSVINAAPGGGTATLVDGFTVKNPRPTLTSVAPNIGSLNQSLRVELIGTNFLDGVSSVDFGQGISINEMMVVSMTQINAQIKTEDWAALGAHEVSVTNIDGGTSTLAKAFAVSNGTIVQFGVPDDLRGAAGDTIEVPLNIDPANRRVASFDAKLGFNSEVLTYLDFNPGPILAGGDWQIDVNASENAINLGAFSANAAISQAGTAVVLLFRVSDEAGRGTTVPLVLSRLSATNTSANALPTEGADGLFTVAAEATISGRLFYFIEHKPLAGDTVQLEILDPATFFQVSDENGNFEFTGVPLNSDAILTPFRVTGNFPAGTITAGDALKAFKGRTGGPEPLTGFESLTADVNGDCQLTSGDALAILKRATGNWQSFTRFGVNDWRFIDAGFEVTAENWCAAPESRFYHRLRADQREQNFVGVLLGDVNGSFGASFEKTAENENVRVAIKHQTAAAGQTNVKIALEINAGDYRYNSFDLTLRFDATKLRVVDVEWGDLLTAKDWQTDWNAPANGVLRLAGFSLNEAAIQGRGNLLILRATLTPPTRAGETLKLEAPVALFGWNGKEILAQTTMANLSFIAPQPQKYALEQNYPNPFVRQNRASATTIAYALIKPEMVTLRIYDMLGNTVRTLVSRHQEAGHYTLAWNGRKDNGALAVSGVYFYRLETGAFIQTHKLILQR